MLAFFALLSGASLVWGNSVSLMPSDAVHTLFVNTSFFVTCMAPQSSLIVWTKGSTQEINHNSGTVYTENSGEDTLSLIFESLHKRDTGEYICKAKFPDSIQDQRFTVNVITPIIFAQSNDVQLAPEGSDYTIRCDASGDGNVTVKLKPNEKKHKELGYQYTPEGFLHIKNVTMDYGGRYSCNAVQVSSQVTSFKESKIFLKIQRK